MAFGASKLKPKVPTGRDKKTNYSYKLITGSVNECERELNDYNDKGEVALIINMTATDNTTTILIKLFT